jgi:hypothetical protein
VLSRGGSHRARPPHGDHTVIAPLSHRGRAGVALVQLGRGAGPQSRHGAVGTDCGGGTWGRQRAFCFSLAWGPMDMDGRARCGETTAVTPALSETVMRPHAGGYMFRACVPGWGGYSETSFREVGAFVALRNLQVRAFLCDAASARGERPVAFEYGTRKYIWEKGNHVTSSPEQRTPAMPAAATRAD